MRSRSTPPTNRRQFCSVPIIPSVQLGIRAVSGVAVMAAARYPMPSVVKRAAASKDASAMVPNVPVKHSSCNLSIVTIFITLPNRIIGFSLYLFFHTTPFDRSVAQSLLIVLIFVSFIYV
jgi:hypothetical protein